MGIYQDLADRIHAISKTPEEYESNRDQIIDYLNGEVDIKSLPQRLQNAFYEWERSQYEYFGTSTEELDFTPEEGCES